MFNNKNEYIFEKFKLIKKKYTIILPFANFDLKIFFNILYPQINKMFTWEKIIL